MIVLRNNKLTVKSFINALQNEFDVNDEIQLGIQVKNKRVVFFIEKKK